MDQQLADTSLADLVRRHLVAENGQDLAGTLATLHPECHFEDLATGQSWHGHEGAAAHYRQWWTTFDVTVQRLADQSAGWPDDNTFIAEATWNGRHVGDFLGIAASGRTIAQRFVVVVGFRDGLMISERFHYDLASLLRQIGSNAVPASPACPTARWRRNARTGLRLRGLLPRLPVKRGLRGNLFFPSPLVGEGGETERSEVEPGEGDGCGDNCTILAERRTTPSPASRLRRSAPSPT